MKTIFAFLIPIAIVSFGISSSAMVSIGGTNVGSGGDEARIRFEEGRFDATERISQIKRCSFSATTAEAVKDWVIENKYKLMEDIEMSRHTWITDKQSTCAFTQTLSKHPITFSFEACRNIQNKEQAGRLLVHESVHHLGVVDEGFADLVAMAVYEAVARASCPDPSNDPFEPSSCTGTAMTMTDALKYFDPGTVESRNVGKIELHGRTRTCAALTGCTAWSGGVEAGFLRPVYSCTGCGSDPVTSFESFLTPLPYGREEYSFRLTAGGGLRLDLARSQFYPPASHFGFRFVSIVGDFTTPIVSDGSFYDSTYGEGIFVLGGKREVVPYRGTAIHNAKYRVTLSGRVTDHCLRLAGSNKIDLPSGQWAENEVVMFSRF